MNKLLKVLFFICCTSNAFALSGQDYMNRFNAYWQWYQQLPFQPTPEFLEFVKGSTPLANKLRDKWLYELARTKDWKQYALYYQSSNDMNLVCFDKIAKLNLGRDKEALDESTPIWLTGESRPQACNTLFELLLKHQQFDHQLITQRMALALDKRNVHLARYLVKQHKHKSSLQDADLLSNIHQNPTSLNKLPQSSFNNEFYLYGLKRLVSLNMDQALALWDKIKNKNIMDEKHQQAFLAHVALYKAMRNNEDASKWFAKIKPQYYNDVLMDWQIRFALKNRNWKQVARLINQAPNKDTPCWQYWLARSLEQQGKKEEAKAIYEPLAQSRQYYGFLASMRLKKKPSFENEKPSTNPNTLKPYQPILDQVKTLYQSKHQLDASRLLNDFISELPKEDASAVVYWVDKELQWHAKSVLLSNTELLNNQLTLRFPLAYQESVKQYAQQYTVPQDFVYAIIRQESGFREDVTSSAGALGLMQVMPRTASVVSKSDKITYTHPQQLFTSQKNINIGTAYLKQLSKRFSNHPILVAAAYNAGPHQVVHWLRTHPPKEIDVWIETLPWAETRNYLKNVMAFCVVYQFRLNQKPDLNRFLTPW